MNASPLLSQFRISAAMRPYVLRVKLRGTDFDFGFKPEQAVAYTKCIEEMKRILVKKGRISAIAADRAILKPLEAAFDFQLSALRYRFLKRMEAQSHTTLDHLIRLLRQLSHAVAQLPPKSKGELNKGVVEIIGQGQFDSEVFIEIVERISAILPQIGPRRLADNIRSLIHPEPCKARRPPIIDQWEAMPATTRVKVERMRQASSPRSLVRWLDNVADLLERERPAGKQGAPRSISQVFVSRVANGKGAECTAEPRARAGRRASVTAISSPGCGRARRWQCAGPRRQESAGSRNSSWRPNGTGGSLAGRE